MLSPCHHSFFFLSLSWHLWVGFPWPKFPLSEPVPCRQPATSMQWQFKSVRLTGSGCDSGRRAPAGKDANATCRAVLWQKVRGTRRCGASGSFLSVSPGIRPSFSSSRLVRETGAGAVPGPFASQRARERERLALKWCHPHALTAAEDLSRALLCKQERIESHFDPDIGRRLEFFGPQCSSSWRLFAVPSGLLHMGALY